MPLSLIHIPTKEYVDIPAGNPGGIFVAGYSAGSKDKNDSASLEQRKLEAVNQVAQESEKMGLLQQQQEVARMNAMTSAANAERLNAQQGFMMQKEANAQQQGQQFLEGVSQSLNQMTTPQVPMRRQEPTLDQQAQAVQANLPYLQSPQMMLEGMRSVTGMKAEARQEREKTQPDSYRAVPIVDEIGNTLGYRGPTGFIPLQGAVTVYDDNGNRLGTSVPPRTKMDKPGSGLGLGSKYGINSGSATNSTNRFRYDPSTGKMIPIQ